MANESSSLEGPRPTWQTATKTRKRTDKNSPSAAATRRKTWVKIGWAREDQGAQKDSFREQVSACSAACLSRFILQCMPVCTNHYVGTGLKGLNNQETPAITNDFTIQNWHFVPKSGKQNIHKKRFDAIPDIRSIVLFPDITAPFFHFFFSCQCSTRVDQILPRIRMPCVRF